MSITDCDVLICGLGPVGDMLALLLGDLGVRTIAVDEASEPYNLPRAAVIDDEVLRIFQSAGLHEQILRNAQVQTAVTYVTDAGHRIEVFRPEQGELGHPPLVSIHQPSMEQTMVAALQERGTVEMRWSHRVETIDQTAEQVTAWLRPVSGGVSEPITARYLVGCDGGRSAVRGRLQVPFGGSTFAQRWLVIDALVDRPLQKVPHTHFVGSTERPIVTLPMSPGRHRWEFMLHPGEDQAPFLEPTRISELIAPWIVDETIEVERAVVYTFHARTAERWRVGRVLLAGDAAHVMPPFVGQGFSSGARDASNLAWKLEAVLNGAPDRLLDSYETERRPHVTSMQGFAVRWGGVVQTTDRSLGAARDAAIELAERTGFLAWGRERVKPRPAYKAGAFACKPHRNPFRRTVGSLFPQPDQLDEKLGYGWGVVSRSPDATARWRQVGLNVIELHGDAWLTRNRCDWALLRPDRYVFACGGPDDVAGAMAALRTSVAGGLRTEKKTQTTPMEVTA